MKLSLVALSSVVLLFSCATPNREQSLVNKAVDAMGGTERLAGIKTITFKGNAKYWEPEQSDAPGGDARFANESSFEGFTDVASRSSRIDWVRNFAYPAPRTFTFSEIVTPEAGYVLGVDSNGRNAQNLKMTPPAHSMSGLRLATSQRELRRGGSAGLMLAMQRNPDKVQPAADINGQPAVSYEGLLVAFDPATGLPSRVRSLDYDNIWGDVNYDLVFSNWRDVGDGIKIAMSRKTELNGRTLTDATFTGLQFNQPVDTARLQVPAELREGAAKPATRDVPYQWVLRRQFIGTYMDSDNVSFDPKGSPGLRLQQVASGVFQIQGGTHNSLVIEMSDHLIVIDAPVTDGQSMWLVGATRAQFPGKPIRWVVLTHHHMDHAGGVRALLAEANATLVVGQGAGAHFRKVLEAPMTRNPDLKAQSFHMNPILEVPESHVMSDSRGRQVIVYVMDNPHAKGMLMGWIPDAKLGYVTDIWTPGPPLPAKPNPGLLSVVNTVKRAGIQPDRFAGGHGSTDEYAKLVRLAGQ